MRRSFFSLERNQGHSVPAQCERGSPSCFWQPSCHHEGGDLLKEDVKGEKTTNIQSWILDQTSPES